MSGGRFGIELTESRGKNLLARKKLLLVCSIHINSVKFSHSGNLEILEMLCFRSYKFRAKKWIAEFMNGISAQWNFLVTNTQGVQAPSTLSYMVKMPKGPQMCTLDVV